MSSVRPNRTALKEISRRSGRHTLYDVLQISPHADEAVLQAAYRALARANHPDLNADASAAERMRELNEAYDLLSDPRRRAVYDLSLNQQRAAAESSDNSSKIGRRTSCWQCSEPLKGGFGRHCSKCHWLICDGCRGCGCTHPTWRPSRDDDRSPVVAWIGWLVAALLAISLVGCALGPRLVAALRV
jgi:DnaJ domain